MTETCQACGEQLNAKNCVVCDYCGGYYCLECVTQMDDGSFLCDDCLDAEDGWWDTR